MKKIIMGFAVISVALAGVFAEEQRGLSGASDSGGTARIIPDDPVLTHEAVEYYKKLTAPLQTLKEANYNYAKSVTRIRRVRKIEKSRQEQLRAITSISKQMKKYGPLRDDDTLRSEIVRYLDLTYIVLKRDFDKILDMEDIEAQSYDRDEAHQLAIDLAVEKLNATFNIMRKAEKAYFRKYQINVTETKDEMSLKIERANKAIEYYNGIYRIFFKVNKEDSYARKALAEKDVAALEQHLTTLVSFAEECSEKLKQLSGYEGDDDLLKITIEAVEFYRFEGEKTYPANIEFFIQTDNFQNASKKLHAKRESDRTQKDVDEYNNSITVYNKKAAEINKINKISYKKQNDFVKRWNSVVDRFFRKHS